MFNFCVLSGPVLEDPKISFLGENNTPVAEFYLSLRGVNQQKFRWIRVFCTSRLAITVAKYLHRGSRVAVIGFLSRVYSGTRDGKMGWEVQVDAMDLEIIAAHEHQYEGEEPTGYPPSQLPER